MNTAIDLFVAVVLLIVLAVLTILFGAIGFGIGFVIIVICAITMKRTYCEVCSEQTKGGNICGKCFVKHSNRNHV